MSENIQMSYQAMNWLRRFISNRKLKLLEFGSGASTVWYAQTFPRTSITTVENKPFWKEWLEKSIRDLKLENITIEYYEQEDGYLEPNPDIQYAVEPLSKGKFDVVINDGILREVVGDLVLKNIDEVINPGGIYLRHDYENFLNKDWAWFNAEGNKDIIPYGQYEDDNHKLITIAGDNDHWGTMCEFGGIWRLA